ncbi:hypothetical protein RJT34_31321 [Clitoria ternatea]|uniref:Transcription factor GTE4 n=1 Tax=Clitoria ternatea TaxID=43366 RepID=A0AAN9EUF9_CLITE
MASGPMVGGGDDGNKENKRFSERKVYTRKAFKGPKKENTVAPTPTSSINDTVAPATTSSKTDTVSATAAVANDDRNNNSSTAQNSYTDGSKGNTESVLAQPLVPQQPVPEDGNLVQPPVGSRLEDDSPQPQLKDQNNTVQPQLGGQNRAELQFQDQNRVEPQLGDQNGAESPLEKQSTIQLEDQNRAEPRLEEQNTALLQLEEQNMSQPQLEEQITARPQLGDQNRAEQQLGDQNGAEPHLGNQNRAEPHLGNQNSAEPQVEVQNTAQLQLEEQNMAEAQLEYQNTDRPQLEEQNTAQSRSEEQNTARPQSEELNMAQPQLEEHNMARSQLEEQSTAQSQLEEQNTAQPQLEELNTAQPRLEEQNTARPQLEEQNTAMPQLEPQNTVAVQLEQRNIVQPQVRLRLEDQSMSEPQLSSRLEDATSSQQQVNSGLEENLPQPQGNSRLEEGDLPQAEGNSLPEASTRQEDQGSPQPQVNSSLEGGSLVQPPVVMLSDDSGCRQQDGPSSLNVLTEDDGPSSPSQQEAVPSTRDLTLGNGAMEPQLKDRIKINLASKSKQQMRELRSKLESELDIVRNLVKRIEVKQRQVGRYGNLNVLVGEGINNGGGAKRAHSGMGSAGVPPETTRPLHQLSLSLLENSQAASENVEKEKRTPKANQFYHNSEFLLAKDKFPPAESNKKSKLSLKKQTGGEMGFGMGSKFFKSCSSLLEKLMKHKHGWVFNAPVDVEALGLHDYFTIITHPMDLGTVKSRLNKNWYKSPKEFAEDVRLTFHNAMTYNPKGQDVHIMAEQLSKIFEDRWAIIESDYNREMRYGFEYSGGPPAPSPLSRRLPAFTPPALDMRRILDRSESLTQTPKFMSITPSSRTPAPKKPKAKDPNKRDMTFDEKQKLSTNLQSLPSEKLDAIVQIIKKRNSALNQHDDEIEVDIDSVDAETLWELDRFVTNYKKSLSKNKRKAELARARAEALQNAIQKSQAPAIVESPKETQAEERNLPPSLPVQGGNLPDNGSRSSSSTSSSSDSGSSSSDSDSDSSSASGSDAGSQGT